MVNNQSGRTLNRIYAVIDRNGGVAKTTIAMHSAWAVSRQLPVPAEQKNEDETVVLDDKTNPVMEHLQLTDLDSQACHTLPPHTNISAAGGNEFVTDWQTICEAMVSAEPVNDDPLRQTLSFPSASHHLAVANIESIHHHSINSNTDSGNHGLTSLLADTIGSVADRSAFTPNCPPTLDALTRSVQQRADAAIITVKPDSPSTSIVRHSRLTEIKIKIHITAPPLNSSQRRLKKSFAPLTKRCGASKIADPRPRSHKIAERYAKRLTWSEGMTQGESPATHAYKTLVEKIYDG